MVVSPSSATLAVQEDVQFTAEARDEFGNIVPDTISWVISNGGGSIDSDGAFNAATAAGEFSDTVTAALGTGSNTVRASASVTVEPGPVATVMLEPERVTLNIGASQSFEVDVLDEFGNQIPDALVSWKAGPNVGALDSDGTFTAGTKAGTHPAGIQVDAVKEAARASATIEVTIPPGPLARIEISPSSALIESGDVQQYTATGFDQHSNLISELAFLWEATGGDIDQTGLFTAVGPGGRHEVRASASSGGSAVMGTASVGTPLEPPDGLVSWWPGDGNADDVVDGNDGILNGGVTYAPGIVGQAFSFDGTGEVIVDHRFNLNMAEFTIDVWVFPTLLDGITEHILNKEREPPGSLDGIQYEIAIQGPDEPTETTIPEGNFVFFIGGISGLPNDGRGWVDGGEGAPLDIWTHVALTFDGSSAKAYVNGELTRTVEGLSGRISRTPGPFKIGSRSEDLLNRFPAIQFNGLIDEVGIYDRALSDAEIKAIFEAGSAGKVKP